MKDNIKRIRRQATDWEEIKDSYDKGLFSKIHKELTILDNKKINNSVKKWAQYLTDTSLKKIYRWQIMIWKRCSTSHIIREVQIKTTMSCHYTTIRMAQN